MKCKNIYKPPFKSEDIVEYLGEDILGQGGDLKHSVDFVVPQGTPIYAALDGTVVFVKQDSNIGGPNKKYWNDGNRIVIKHENGEYSAYEHLRYHGAMVQVSQNVKQDDVIGYSGNTGYSHKPHLHFEVFNNPTTDESEGVTLEINFHKDLNRKE